MLFSWRKPRCLAALLFVALLICASAAGKPPEPVPTASVSPAPQPVTWEASSPGSLPAVSRPEAPPAPPKTPEAEPLTVSGLLEDDCGSFRPDPDSAARLARALGEAVPADPAQGEKFRLVMEREALDWYSGQQLTVTGTVSPAADGADFQVETVDAAKALPYELTRSVTLANGQTLTLELSGRVAEFWENEIARVFLDRITVLRGQRSLQTLDAPTPVKHFPDDFDTETVDFNFDGNPDLKIFAGAGTAVWYACYLWNPETELFEYNETLSRLPDLAVDPVSQTISAGEPAGATRFSKTFFVWQGGVLAIREVHRTGSGFSEPFTQYSVHCFNADGEIESVKEGYDWGDGHAPWALPGPPGFPLCAARACPPRPGAADPFGGALPDL